MSCLKPIQIRVDAELKLVACGKCPACCYNRLAGWTFRLMQEERSCDSAHFITLTYDSHNLVKTPTNKQSICKYDLQCFFKRLRKRTARGKSNIKYYAVGEYGSKTKRPHYHAILFNSNERDIQLAWQKGEVHFGDVTHASVGYTLKYLNKRSFIGLLGDDDRHPVFAVSSNGLGLSYLTKNTISYHLADLYNRRFLTLPDGYKTAMPRYYYERIYDGYQRDLLKMSGSLIEQSKFYEEFTSVSYEKRMQDIALFSKRVDAAIRRHEFHQSKTLLL